MSYEENTRELFLVYSLPNSIIVTKLVNYNVSPKEKGWYQRSETRANSVPKKINFSEANISHVCENILHVRSLLDILNITTSFVINRFGSKLSTNFHREKT